MTMFCPKCGKQMPDDVMFCPSCGAERKSPTIQPTQPVNPTQPLYQTQPTQPIDPTQPLYQAQSTQPISPTQPVYQTQSTQPLKQTQQDQPKYDATQGGAAVKKRSIKDYWILIVALVTTVALIIGAIFIFRGNGYKSDNVFADRMKDVSKDSSAYQVLDICAAGENTVFNSKSFQIELSENGRSVFDGFIVFGKDLHSAQAYLDVNDGRYLLAMNDGKLVALNGNNDKAVIEVNVENIFNDRKYLLEEITSKMEEIITDMKKHGIDEFNLYEYTISEDFTPETSINVFADFVKDIPDDAVEIELKESNGVKTYTYNIDIGVLLDYAADFYEQSEELAELFTDEAIENAAEVIRDAAEEVAEENIFIKGKVSIEKYYLTSFSVAVVEDDREYGSFKISFNDVNNVEVNENKIEKVFNKADKADDKITIENVDDIDDIINEIFRL